jgi:hypothetical protein
MSHEGSCHCGTIVVTIKDDPVEVTECNCSICRRTGALWTYAPPANVAVAGEGVGYMHGDRMLTFVHCPTCGVITHWSAVDPNYDRMAINLRLFDPNLWEALPRKLVDGASW